MISRSCLAAALLAFAAMAAAGPPTSSLTARGVDHLESFIEHVETLRADFRQQVVNDTQEVVEEASGRLLLKRPGRFRWDYERPYERVVVANGETLWLYEADLQQVTVRSVAAGLGETPAALLTGKRDILDRFELVSAWSGDDLSWVKLRPRSPDSDFESVAIGFSKDTPAQLEIRDRLGQQTRIYLTNVEINVSLPEERFEFTVPQGVDVIREGEI